MNISQANWIPIQGYEGWYEIHPSGNVRSIKRFIKDRWGRSYEIEGKTLKPILNKSHGYYVVGLAKDGKVKQHRLHILVAKHFIPNPENKPTVNHKFGDKSKNSINDLEWATQQEQMDYAAANGLTASGMRNGGNKICDDDVLKAFSECMSGEELQIVSQRYGLNRNTLPKAFQRLGLGDQWRAESLRRKSVASNKRWG